MSLLIAFGAAWYLILVALCWDEIVEIAKAEVRLVRRVARWVRS